MSNPTKWLMCCVINITEWSDNTWISLFNKLIQYLDPIFAKNPNIKFIKYWLTLVEAILINKKIPSICLISCTMPYKHLPGITSVRYKQNGLTSTLDYYPRFMQNYHGLNSVNVNNKALHEYSLTSLILKQEIKYL